MAGVPRKPSDNFDPWQGWELSARNPFLPVGEYTNEAGDVSAGFAMPSIVSEPANALARLLNTPSGTMPNPQNPEMQQDALTGLLSLYGGNAMSGMARGAGRNALATKALSDTGKPSPVGSAIASSAGEKAKGARPEPSALLPKAEAMGASLAETDLSKLAEEAYVKAYRADVDANKHRYFNDWADDPKNPIVADDWGRQIGGSEISESYDNATPFGNRSLLETHPAVANALSDAAAVIGRELYMVPSGSGSSYGQLRTPSGNSYKVRVADHANTSSLHDAPDFNIAPGALSPEEFINLLPTLLSDTGRPSIMGSAIASGAEQGKPIRAYHGTRFASEPLDTYPVTDGMASAGDAKNRLWASSDADVASSYAEPIGSDLYWDEIYPRQTGHTPPPRAGGVFPVEMNFANPLEVDAAGAGFQSVPWEGQIYPADELASLAQGMGHDGLILKSLQDHMYDQNHAPSTVYAALKRGTVRSPLTGEQLFSDQRPSLMGSAVASGEFDPYADIPPWLLGLDERVTY